MVVWGGAGRSARPAAAPSVPVAPASRSLLPLRLASCARVVRCVRDICVTASSAIHEIPSRPRCTQHLPCEALEHNEDTESRVRVMQVMDGAQQAEPRLSASMLAQLTAVPALLRHVVPTGRVDAGEHWPARCSRAVDETGSRSRHVGARDALRGGERMPAERHGRRG